MKKIIETFHEKELQRISQTKLKVEKLIERKGDRLLWKGRAFITQTIAGFIRKT